MNRALILLLFFLVSCGDETKKKVETKDIKNETGLYYVSVNQKIGFIDKDGKIIINPQFDEVAIINKDNLVCFSDGLANVKIGDKYGYIDTEGKYVINLDIPAILTPLPVILTP